jgi:hypothetical protein
MKKVAAIIAVTLILLAFCYVTPIRAQTKDMITLNANGTVTPSTAPIQQDGDTYTLTSGYEGSVLIQRSNIVFDGAGNFIQSPDNVYYCLKLDSVSNITVRNLVVKGTSFGCMYGIELVDAKNCFITNNTVTDVWSIMAMNAIEFDGIHVNGGNSNVFSKNTLANNLLGMNFVNTVNNIIVENSIDYTTQSVNSVPSGINFYQASGNLIYHNTFRAAGGQTGLFESNNKWDNGFPNGGNYWSDYGAGGSNFTKINGTAIYDSPYLINDVNIDHYPLVEPYNAKAPTIVVLSDGGIYNASNVPLVFMVDQQVAWMGYSLDGAQNTSLSGNETLLGLENGKHIVTIYANDSFGNIGSAQREFIVLVPLSPVIIVGIIGLAVAVIVGVVYYRYTKASTKHTKTTANSPAVT